MQTPTTVEAMMPVQNPLKPIPNTALLVLGAVLIAWGGSARRNCRCSITSV